SNGALPNKDPTATGTINHVAPGFESAGERAMAMHEAFAKAPFNKYDGKNAFAPREYEHELARRMANRVHVNLPNVKKAEEFNRLSARSFPSVMTEYMQPYNEAVTERLLKKEQENFERNILPALDRRFVGQGRFGGKIYKQERATAENAFHERMQALRDNALEKSYEKALNAYSLDNGRWIENAKMENTIGNS